MLALILALAFSEGDGGWNHLPVDSQTVKDVQPFLIKNLPLLFPEITNDQFTVVDAANQVVAGQNLKLTIRADAVGILFQIRLYVNLQGSVEVTNIQRAIGGRPILGGFTWQNPEHFSDNQFTNLIRLIKESINMLISPKVTPLVYRTKVENGLKTHVIFRDSNNNLYSSLTFKPVNEEKEKIISVNLIGKKL